MVHEEKAFYSKQELVEFMGNPFIETLPFHGNPGDYPRVLLVKPGYKEEERQQEDHVRLQNLPRISGCHVPMWNDTLIMMGIDRCLRWGYYSRNPMPMEVVQEAIEETGYVFDEGTRRYLTAYKPPCYGFPIIGVSGTGKTCTVENILKRYPQVVAHELYRGRPFPETQVVWMKVDCPGDGTPKGLCVAIIKEVDLILGTEYTKQYITARASKDLLTLAVSKILQTIHLGILVIDDFQNLCSAKEAVSAELQSFVVHLVNTIRVPVIMVGTPKILALLQKEFQIAKRATGEGEVRTELMKRDDGEWTRFMKAIWHYQYTKTPVKLTETIDKALFEESVGNHFLASVLYKLVQDDAIVSGRETFSAKDIRRVASEKLGITAQKRKDMLNGKDIELNRYMCLWAAADTYKAAKKQPQVQKKVSSSAIWELVAEVAGRLTTALGIADKDAQRYARSAVAANPGETDRDALFGFAVLLFGKEQESDKKKEGGQDNGA